jgi:triosephosphate isomerase
MQITSKRKRFVAGNWKMQGSKLQSQTLIQALVDGLSHLPSIDSRPDILICPSFPYLSEAQQLLNNTNASIHLGAQDLSAHAAGAYTGQVSGDMLTDIGCTYVLIGHSERRQHCHESNDLVADKFFAAKRAGLIPILCIGETLEQRQNNQTESLVSAQLNAVLLREGAEGLQGAIIAYEPVWAIGTGQTATPEEAQQVHHFVRQLLAKHNEAIAASLTIVYGGSVKASNAADLFAMPDIDGALVGGASLDAKEFLSICQSACYVGDSCLEC